jgi:hypothetical protein
MPEAQREAPAGLISSRGDPAGGSPAGGSRPGEILEAQPSGIEAQPGDLVAILEGSIEGPAQSGRSSRLIEMGEHRRPRHSWEAM